MQVQFEGVVETTAGPAFVRHIGDSGPTCLAFHGGPGFEQDSLIAAVEPVLARRQLIFFDQLGCGRTPAPDTPVTAEATFAHAAAVLDLHADRISGILAYSWGTVVAAAAFDRRPARHVSESLLICPTPVYGAGYAAARAAIGARIPPEAMQRMIAKVAAGAPGGEAFAEVQPYYTASGTAVPEIEVNAAVYMSVDASLGESFDFRAALDRLGAMAVIAGAEDFPPPDAVAPFVDRSVQTVAIPGAAHYPYAENPGAFAAAVRLALAQPC